MRIKLSGKSHLFEVGTQSFVVSFRKKEWRFMAYAMHYCSDKCEAKIKPYPLFSLKLTKIMRKQRFHEWVQWEPDEDDFMAWEAYTAKKNKLTEAEIERFSNSVQNSDDIWKELDGE